LAAGVKAAHDRGLKVILLPPAAFHPQAPYGSAGLTRIAAEAQAARVDVLCVSWLNTDPDPAWWSPQIAAARKIFTGRIMLASTPDVFPRIEFADAVDLVGVIGPIPIGRRLPSAPADVDLHAMRIAW